MTAYANLLITVASVVTLAVGCRAGARETKDGSQSSRADSGTTAADSERVVRSARSVIPHEFPDSFVVSSFVADGSGHLVRFEWYRGVPSAVYVVRVDAGGRSRVVEAAR